MRINIKIPEPTKLFGEKFSYISLCEINCFFCGVNGEIPKSPGKFLDVLVTFTVPLTQRKENPFFARGHKKHLTSFPETLNESDHMHYLHVLFTWP
ncbi:hypothetical protein CDAR_275751 [Caerostris darwini]|uniref:Uncharacterized protein n=1 Tax=Caerostris darwini TaxID=1538125 RepID=A0AAV4NH92_9ARAC|nr:hypothetical protein CDAR_275751 [Caerostris darwini]